jgi:hypothetical protein
MRALVSLAAALVLSSPAVSAPDDEKPPDTPLRLEIALDKKEYPFRGAIALTITYTNVSKDDVVLWANGSPPGEGFPGETFEITSGAGRKAYTIFAVEPKVEKVTIAPGKSWKRTIKDLAPVLSNTGVAIDGKVPGGADPQPDPFGRLDEYTIRVSFRSAVKDQPKPAFNGTVESNTQKFKVVLR